MIDISVNGLKKYFGGVEFLHDITFDVREGEKIGLIGKNGAGKTTLFRILIALAQGERDTTRLFEDGSAAVNTSKRVGLIDQIPVYPDGYTSEDVLKTAFARFDGMRERMKTLERELEKRSDKALLREYGDLSSQFEREGGYTLSMELECVANGLGLGADIRSRPFKLLSGGEQTRVNLGRVILQKAEILLLDEPTNHLDIDSVEWLGEYLHGYKGAVLLISHDRCFLDDVCEKIVEIEDGRSYEYFGNYSYYAVEKERRREEALKEWQAQEKERKRMTELALRYRSWATEANMKKALVVEHKLERMTVRDRPRRERAMKAGLNEAAFFADEALKLKAISKSYGDNTVLRDVTGLINGGERVCIFGPNGCGKTTLLSIIMKETEADGGTVRFGPSVKRAYLPQKITFENVNRTVLEEVLFSLPLGVQAARDRLASFKFTGEDVCKPIRLLSGGERSRLRLCIMMNEELNFLILDEPTNHLDLASREWMESLLEDFSGVILFVSHDKYFVTRFATRVWDFENGSITDYKCGFEEYRRRKRALSALASETAVKEPKAKKESAPISPLKAQKMDMRRREAAKREAEALEKRLERIEREMDEFAADYERLSALLEEKNEVENSLLKAYEEQ